MVVGRPAAIAALALALLAGCGGPDDPAPFGGAAGVGRGGELVWAIPERPLQRDPLFARGRTERLISRQLHEPLVEELSAPFDDPRRLNGLARSVVGVHGDTVWLVRLRPGVRFQDGTPLNSQAVLANVERWLAAPHRSGFTPGALADGPRPDLVRFRLPEPDPEFADALAAPELGIVAPAALERAGSGSLTAAQTAASGTGPFELRERAADRLLLARNSDWWGSDKGLGPALDQLEFLVVRSASERVDLLGEGTVQAAGDLGRAALEAIASDPLLTAVEDSRIGIERSVRGIPAGERVPSLNAVWRTSIHSGA